MSAVRTVEPDEDPEQLARARLNTVTGKIRVAALPKHMACSPSNGLRERRSGE